MKRKYISPRLFVLNAETANMICASYEVKGRTKWGATAEEHQYGNDLWVNEGYQNMQMQKGGMDVVDFADDEEDLPSR